MQRLGVAESDFTEKFSRSPGKGGQNVNKVETAVTLVYLPKGLSVKSHAERTQGANRVKAWFLLLARIEAERNSARQAKIAKAELIRRQNRRRSVLGKEKMLAQKRIHSLKKQARKMVRDE